MNHLTVLLPYCTKDLTLARNLLLWIGELGGCPNHSCLLGADSAIKQEDRDELKKLAQDVFGHASSVIVTVGQVEQYQQACNRMFERLSFQLMQTTKWPFLWLEPDCVPLKKGWLDELADGYYSQPRRYFGPIIKSEGAVSAPADIKQHLAAVSVYPVNAHSDLAEYTKGARCWDMASHEFLPPRATDQKLIHHFWAGPDNQITFKTERTDEDPVNVRTVKSIWPEAVLFHQSKDGSLINVLRDRVIVPPDLSPDLKKLHPANKAK
jgi:hypothetical protein